MVFIAWKTKGVESIGNNTSEIIKITEKVAKKFKTIDIITGAVDIITDNNTSITKSKDIQKYCG